MAANLESFWERQPSASEASLDAATPADEVSISPLQPQSSLEQKAPPAPPHSPKGCVHKRGDKYVERFSIEEAAQEIKRLRREVQTGKKQISEKEQLLANTREELGVVRSSYVPVTEARLLTKRALFKGRALQYLSFALTHNSANAQLLKDAFRQIVSNRFARGLLCSPRERRRQVAGGAARVFGSGPEPAGGSSGAGSFQEPGFRLLRVEQLVLLAENERLAHAVAELKQQLTEAEEAENRKSELAVQGSHEETVVKGRRESGQRLSGKDWRVNEGEDEEEQGETGYGGASAGVKPRAPSTNAKKKKGKAPRSPTVGYSASTPGLAESPPPSSSSSSSVVELDADIVLCSFKAVWTTLRLAEVRLVASGFRSLFEHSLRHLAEEMEQKNAEALKRLAIRPPETLIRCVWRTVGARLTLTRCHGFWKLFANAVRKSTVDRLHRFGSPDVELTRVSPIYEGFFRGPRPQSSALLPSASGLSYSASAEASSPSGQQQQQQPEYFSLACSAGLSFACRPHYYHSLPSIAAGSTVPPAPGPTSLANASLPLPSSRAILASRSSSGSPYTKTRNGLYDLNHSHDYEAPVGEEEDERRTLKAPFFRPSPTDWTNAD